MAITTLDDLVPLLRRGQRLLGVDVGTRTLGLALSDVTLTVATPLRTISRTRLQADLGHLDSLAGEHDVGGFVLGLPVGMDGREGPRAQAVRQFARDLDKTLHRPIAFWDERFSTAAVERTLIEEADMTRRRRRQVIDRAAAAYILQGALDRLHHGRAREDGPARP